MAIHADTIWECRATGHADNGGGFYNRSAGVSIDRSQQNAAHATLTSAKSALNAANAAIVDVHADDYTVLAGDVGNILRITGGDATAGYYEITVADTENNRWTLDRSAGSTEDSVAGRMGGASTDIKAVFEVMVFNNIVWVKKGTYTITEAVAVSGNSAATTLKYFLGYNATRGDKPKGDDRPTITTTAAIAMVTLSTGGQELENFIFTTSGGTPATYAVVAGADRGQSVSNCKAVSMATAGFSCHIIANSEAVSCAIGFILFSNRTTINCLSKSNTSHGFSSSGNDAGNIISCVATQNGGSGITIGSALLNSTILGCVAYDNASNGISQGTTYHASFIMNCISKDNATGIATRAKRVALGILDYNCVQGNTTNYSGVIQGANDVTADPKLTDPDKDDFTLQSDSPCLDVGVDVGTYTGATT